MIKKGIVKPTVYKERYYGLEDVPKAMNDLAARSGVRQLSTSGEEQSPDCDAVVHESTSLTCFGTIRGDHVMLEGHTAHVTEGRRN